MKEYDRHNPLVSIHMPKAAGTSFKRVLNTWFGMGLLLHYHNERRNTPPKKHNLNGLFLKTFARNGICVHGHFNKKRGNGVLDYYPEVGQFITVLRDPFELCLSNYFYVKKMNNKAFRDGKVHHIIDNGYDLKEYLEKTKSSYMKLFMPCEMDLHNYRDVLNEHFVYIGITEDLQTSVDCLANKLSFGTVKVPRVNESSREEEEVPNEARDIFNENNRLECEIYDYVKEVYRL